MISKKGRFIVVTGGEGSGKSTQVKRAAKEFAGRVIATREPGGSPYAEEIRRVFLSDLSKDADAQTKLLLAFAARSDHLKSVIRPALEAGKLVICDRFDSDTFAYQLRAEGGGRQEELFWKLRESVLGDAKPDIYVHFDIEPADGIARKLNQGAADQNVYDAKPLTFHHKVYEGIKEFANLNKHGILGVRIDAGPAPEQVWEKFKEIVEGQLNFLG